MTTVFAPLPRRALFIAMLLSSVSAPALADSLTVTDITTGLPATTTLTVPSIDLVDSGLSEADVRAFFAGERNADTLVNLEATSVTIPELTVSGQWTPSSDGTGTGTLTLHNITLSNVANGVAGEVAVESATLTTSKDANFDIGSIALTNVNLNYLAVMAHAGGSTEGLDPRDLESIWSSLSIGPVSVTASDGTCKIGGIEGGGVSVRMLERTTFGEIGELSAKTQGQSGTPGAMSDDAVKLQSAYYDLLTSYAADPVSLTDFSCNVPDSNKPDARIDLSVGQVDIGAASPGQVPDTTMSDVRIKGDATGWVEMQSLHVLPTDYAAVAALFEDVGMSGATGQWMRDNQRQLIPSFGGFEMGGLSIDVPDSTNPTQRIEGSVGAIDMLLDSYVNGIPTDVRTSGTDINFKVTEASRPMLQALGLDPFNLSYSLAVHWDRSAQAIAVDNVLVSAENGGTVILSAVLGNAKPQLFSFQPGTAIAAAQGLTLKELHLHLADAGLLGHGIELMAAQQGVQPDAFRTAMSGMAQATLVMGMGASPDAMSVASAVAAFVNNGGELSLSAVAKKAGGVPMSAFVEAQGNPASVLQQFNVTVDPAEDAEPDATGDDVTPDDEMAPTDDDEMTPTDDDAMTAPAENAEAPAATESQGKKK